MLKQLTQQERLFLQRVALKHEAVSGLTIEQAMRAVCEDDARLFETFVIMPDRQKTAFVSAFSASVYRTIRARDGRPQ